MRFIHFRILIILSFVSVNYIASPQNPPEATSDEKVEASQTKTPSDPQKVGKALNQNAPKEVWTWKDAAGNIKSEAEFKEILNQHAEWLATEQRSGSRADFTDSDLTGVDLQAVNLNKATMLRANLAKANMTATFLNEADLRGAQFSETTIFALMHDAILQGASFNHSKISGTLSGSDLSNSKIFSSDFTGTNLARANLSGSMIFDSNFTNVLLGSADLTNATVMTGDWTGVNLLGANVEGLKFEPTKNPEIRFIAGAANLEFITFATSPDAIALLRNAFTENGFEEAQRKITYALKHRQNELRREHGGDSWFKYVYYYLNLILFDWTVRYGLQPERALIIMFYLWLVFAVAYDLFIHMPGRSGIFLVKNRVRKSISLTSAMRIHPREILSKGRWKYWRSWISSEWRVLRISLYFSATSALRLGYGALDLGRWLGMLTKREYELRPKHWSRSLSGLQSLISMYLVVMWVLTEFSTPFN